MVLQHPMVARAVEFATFAHSGQRRKYIDEPYITHPIAVAEIVASIGARPEMVAAAVLHDTVEDTAVSHADIHNRFGDDVGYLVWGLTDTSRPEDGNRALRRKLDRYKLALVCPDTKSLKLADLIHNSGSITACDPHFAVTYMEEKGMLLPLLAAGNATLFARAWKIMTDWQEGQVQEALSRVPVAC